MKLLISFLSILACLSSLSAQQKKAPRLPFDNKLVMEKFLSDVYNAYYEAYDKKNYKNFAKYFGGNACEIGPDVSLVYSLKSLKEMWPKMDQMLDSKPSFDYKLTSSRMITSDVALITWDVNSNILVKGNQVGGKMTGVAVLKKNGNNWSIEMDGIVPVIAMPEMPAEAPPVEVAPAPAEEKKE